MTVETNINVDERRCYMVVRGLMAVLPGKPLYHYVLNMTAKPVYSP